MEKLAGPTPDVPQLLTSQHEHLQHEGLFIGQHVIVTSLHGERTWAAFRFNWRFSWRFLVCLL